MKIKCIIVEDEPLAQRILEKYIASLSSLELLKKCNNALEAMSFLHKNEVDLMFLDIKMPELTGIEFLRTLTHPPQVIITSAHSEYALEGYEYSVADYLLKPFSFERFLKAVNKVTSANAGNEVKLSADGKQHDFIFIKADRIDHKIYFSEIKYIEGCGNYIKVFTNDQMLMVAETMTTIEKNLPSELFIRTHKSYIVSIKKIDQIEGNMIRIGDKTLPIGNYYRMRVTTILEKFNLRK
jgi:DNA-binding LytR/AlgR family response regulator